MLGDRNADASTVGSSVPPMSISPDERLRELATVLAAGLRRSCRSRPATPATAAQRLPKNQPGDASHTDFGATCLELSPQPGLSVTTRLTVPENVAKEQSWH